MNEAVFTRTDTPEGVRFDVTPADAPAGSKLFYASASGCFVLLGALFVGVVSFIILFYAFMLIFAVIRVPGLDGIGPTSLFSLAGAIAVIVWRANKGGTKRKAVDRRPVSLLVSSAGIVREGTLIPASDIAELMVKLPNDRGGIRPATTKLVPHGTMAGGAYIGGQRMGAEMLNRSFALMVRRRSISTPEILAGGLTWNTGEALMNDVSEAME